MSNLSSSDYIAIVASFIALLAFLAVFWQGYLTWKHNKLSVKPHIDITRNLILGEPISVKIRNHGLGPAIINKIYYFIDNKKFDFSDKKSIDEFINYVDFLKFNASFLLNSITNETILGSDTEITLLSFDNSHMNLALQDHLFNNIGKLTVKVEYCCIYGCKYFKESPPLGDGNKGTGNK